MSYAQVAGAGNKDTPSSTPCGSDGELCPTYLMSGKCQLGDQCSYIHGLMCEVCQLACLHPFDGHQRRIHKEVCVCVCVCVCVEVKNVLFENYIGGKMNVVLFSL